MNFFNNRLCAVLFQPREAKIPPTSRKDEDGCRRRMIRPMQINEASFFFISTSLKALIRPGLNCCCSFCITGASSHGVRLIIS